MKTVNYNTSTTLNCAKLTIGGCIAATANVGIVSALAYAVLQALEYKPVAKTFIIATLGAGCFGAAFGCFIGAMDAGEKW